MSVRRRRIKERRDRAVRYEMGSRSLSLCLQQIHDAATAALARGETEVTDRFMREAFEYRPADRVTG